MTTHELASSVAVIKNVLALHKIEAHRAVWLLWDLVVEASPHEDLHYVPGMSDTIDKLLVQLHAEGKI